MKNPLIMALVLAVNLFLFSVVVNAHEIHLKNGRTIRTNYCWEEGNLIKYELYGSIIGIDKKQVKKIKYTKDMPEQELENQASGDSANNVNSDVLSSGQQSNTSPTDPLRMKTLKNGEPTPDGRAKYIFHKLYWDYLYDWDECIKTYFHSMSELDISGRCNARHVTYHLIQKQIADGWTNSDIISYFNTRKKNKQWQPW